VCADKGVSLKPVKGPTKRLREGRPAQIVSGTKAFHVEKIEEIETIEADAPNTAPAGAADGDNMAEQ
jgi:hypothetical protein